MSHISISEFINEVGAKRVAEIVKCSRPAVLQWKHLRNAPHPTMAFKLIIVSNGRLSWDSIYSEYVKKKLKGQKIMLPSITAGVNQQLEFKF